MSYVVSARRWRPQTFEDLVGQEHVSRTLAGAIRAGRVAHAFLFTGVRGVGKTTAARILAKALNCETGPTPTPCNECTNCREITAGSAVDVLEIDGASNTGVDDVREIIENVRYRPAKSRFKIYIIDEVHMLSNSAFNALLKTLEEPPAHVKFIFATTDPHKLPATVQSRCQRYDFRRIPLALVVERLRRIAGEEKVRISDRALFMLAREGEGSMRDAQSLLDQVLAGAGGEVSDEDIVQTLGVADRQVVHDIGAAIVGRDAGRALDLLAEVYRQGYDLRRLARDLVEHFRNLAVAQVSQGSLLPDMADEEAAALREQAARIGAGDCDRAFRILREADEETGRSPYPKLILEMALIKLASLPPLLPLDTLIERLEDLEGRLGRSSERKERAEPPARKTTARAGDDRPSATASRAAPGAEEPARRPAPAAANAPAGASWDGFLAFVNQRRATLGHHLAHCKLLGLDDGALEIEAPTSFRFDYLARREHVTEMEDLVKEFFGGERRVTLRRKSDAAAGPGGDANGDAKAPAPADLATAALGNPIVRAAVDILGGEVAEVRARRPRRREDG
jgi:DNA polymerase-3 subunit gamma/tau